MPNTQSQLNDPNKQHKVYIVEDHNTLRRMIVGFISRLFGLVVIGQAASGPEALEDPIHKSADIIITDLSMPGITGIELSRRLCAENPDYLIIVLTAHDERFLISKAFDAGASAFVLKDDPFVLEDVIKRLLKGEKKIVSLA